MARDLFAGRYQIGPQLGSGAVGTVYRARDVTTGQQVAVKILRPDLAADPAARARFAAEVRIAAQLAHPNIVRIIDHGEVAGRPYMVMEYLPEPDLRDIIRRYAPLPEDKVAQFGIDCCKALQYAHSRGVVHRDIKPQNILFTSEGVAKLGDFGIAAAAGAGTAERAGKVLGTPAYMAPEVAAGGRATARSDIYSLGCVLYHAVTGRLPFGGGSAEEVMRQHLRARPARISDLNPNVSPALEMIIAKAMAKDPERRYAAAAQLQADLEKILSGQDLGRTGVLQPPRQAAVPKASPRAPEPSGRATLPSRTGSPALAGAFLVLAIVIAVLLVWFTKRAFYPGQAPVLVQVPSVKGLTEHQARQKLAAHGLVVGPIRYAPHTDTFPEGTVIEQRPEMGSTVEKGTAVALVINRGRSLTTVPDVTGMQLEQAQRRLRKLNLTVGEVQRRYDDSVPAGRVIKQSVEADTKVESGTSVDLVVSRGPQPPPQSQPQPPTAPGPSGEPQAQQTAAPEEAEPAVPPDVIVTDLTPDKPIDEAHQYEIRVTALGRKLHQEIEVVAVDASGKRDILLHTFVDPQQSKSVKVWLKGPARIEVYHENLNVLNQQVPVTEIGPSPEGLTAPGGAMAQ